MTVQPQRPRSGAAIVVLCLLGGALFLASLHRLWPLADADLTRSAAEMQTRAREVLTRRGFDLTGYRGASALVVDTRALDYVERSLGRKRAQGWIVAGFPLVLYQVELKRRGDTGTFTVDLHPDGATLGWSLRVEDDEPGARLEPGAARRLAHAALTDPMGLNVGNFDERSATTTEQVERRDHVFILERVLEAGPDLRERVVVRVAGDRVVLTDRSIRVPPGARREARAGQAAPRVLETLGFLSLTALVLAGLFVFLRGLGRGQVDLARARFWPAVVFVCLLGTWALERPSLFRYWEPLWPKWVSDLQYLTFRGAEGLLLVLLLLVVIGAGDALDRATAAGRGASLWTLARGRIDGTVARASWRGFLVGLLCGGVLAAAVGVLQFVVGAHTSIQPRGFFFYTLNTASPLATSLLFFLGVALTEELGYRFFAGAWILQRGGRRWLAILVPAVVYGLTHTRLDFLPPAEPWWGRALALAAVGCVWGWAFFRFDALTVVLSHFTADLFIFNWPRLASGEPRNVGLALLTVAVPLLPAVWYAVRSIGRPSTTHSRPA